MNLKLTVLIEARAAAAAVPDPGDKSDDRPGERRRRHEALAGVRAAMDVEDEVTAEAAAATAARVDTAVWLGASLADLAAVTGRSRQAARKRWPTLGPVARRRRWLGHHVDEVLWAADLVVAHADAFPGGVVDELKAGVDGVRRAFDGDGDGDGAPVRRWRMLDDLVHRGLRSVALLADPDDERACFARHGAAGVVAYYDHALRRDVEDGAAPDGGAG